MTNTNRDELKSTNDSELPWMAKGSKGSTRRDEKAIVRVAGSSVENEDKSSSGTVAKESDHGKLHGQHVAERVGRVPVKKRRILVASLSPRKSSGRSGSSEHRLKINHVSKLNPNLTDGGTSDEKDDSIGHDFSGIEILADAACNLSKYLAPSVDRLPAEEPVVQQQDATTILAFGGMVADNKGESENLSPDSGAVTMSFEPTAEKKKSIKETRFHWDLNVPMDAWGPPCDIEDDASGKDVEGEITESMSPKESKPIDGSKDHLDGLVASDGQEKFSSPSGLKAKEAARKGNEFQSDYDSQLEDGELKGQYRLGRNEVEDEEIEPKDYELEPENEGFSSMAESNDNKMEDSGKRIMTETKSGSDIDKKDLHLRKGSSSSRRFASKPFKEFPSHDDAIPRTKSDDYKELSMGPYRLSGRDDMSGRGSRPRYVLESPHPKCMMGGFDQSRSWSGQGSQSDHGYVRNRFSNRGYSGMGRLRMYPNGGDRVFRGRQGYNNQFPGRMDSWMSGNRRERGDSPVFRRSRSRSPVPWNVRDRLSPRMMERVRLPFQKRFSENQEIGLIMSPLRLSERRSYDSRENHDSFRKRNFLHGQGHDDVGSSLRRLNPDNDNNFIPFRRHGRFDGAENSTGRNKFEMGQQKTRRAWVREDGGDDMLDGSCFTKKRETVVVANNNKKCNDNKKHKRTF